MRFEDEQYVRVYRRDTTTWLMMNWQGRCILPLILRKLDRAGLLDLEGDGYDALAAHIQVPVEIVEEGMKSILRRGTLVLREDGLLMAPRFIEAQEAKQSDKARQKLARDRARDLAGAAEKGIQGAIDAAPDDEHLDSPHVTHRDGAVTHRDAVTESGIVPDENVTRGHAASHGVTLSCAEHSYAQTNRGVQGRAAAAAAPSGSHEPSTSAPPAIAPKTIPLPLEPGPVSAKSPEAGIDEVFQHWVAGWKQHVGGTRSPALNDKRRGKIRARLREGFTVDDLKRSIDGMWSNGWNVENHHTDIELVCRDEAHVQRYLAKHREAFPAAARFGRLPPREDDDEPVDVSDDDPLEDLLGSDLNQPAVRRPRPEPHHPEGHAE